MIIASLFFKFLTDDLPILQQVVNGKWNKERELAELKNELASIERKIHLSINENNTKVDSLDDEQVGSKVDDKAIQPPQSKINTSSKKFKM
ncbi:hypothetical protein [Candidatus Ornithobacterium hominis]|uniref:hypothetical protein n=1 Tax=Candidatus Ornithobacterium hominis TaxID=2497989 RepID=UPI0024BC6D19|nr:hypothetical protein [Candidatus Ornithobacterium hominis]